MWTITCNLLKTVLKVRKRMVVWVQKGCKEMVVYPHDQRADCELQLPLPSITRRSYYISLVWDKDQYSEIGSFKVSTQRGLLFHHHKVKIS